MNAVTAAETGTLAPELWVTLLKSFGVLCVVLALVLAMLYFLRRVSEQSGKLGNRGALEVVATYSVGAKERIILMRVMNALYLIGVTPQQINCIAELPDNPEGLSAYEPAMEKGFRQLFAGVLRREDSKNG